MAHSKVVMTALGTVDWMAQRPVVKMTVHLVGMMVVVKAVVSVVRTAVTMVVMMVLKWAEMVGCDVG